MTGNSIPSIDFSASDGSDKAAQETLVQQLRAACQTYGFFQLTGHGIPQTLLDEVMEQSEKLFALPLDVKEKYSKDQNPYNRGYERLRAQNFEKRTAGDLKEGFYFGRDLPPEHPSVAAGKFIMGPNTYPEELPDAARFRGVVDRYVAAMLGLAERIVRMLCRALEVDDGWVPEFVRDPISILRLLHYPPQPPDASELERGIGAHTDFGAITILHQDSVGGLQVWDREASTWIDVRPTRGAFVVNLGNLMMRWTNDQYVSNLHRVINRSGQERYSVPFFFSGNPDFVVECFSRCRGAGEAPKYPPITVEQWLEGRYADTYGGRETGKGRGKVKAIGDPYNVKTVAGFA
ncbi:hypothetical protein AAE478_002523 [Parahypoxylon ruwenzoriense]